jgi:hypothetical protein
LGGEFMEKKRAQDALISSCREWEIRVSGIRSNIAINIKS